MNNELAYWITLAHLPNWSLYNINSLVVKFHHDNHLSIEEFFNLPELVWSTAYQLTEAQIHDVKNARTELAGNAFLAESMINQGYEIIPIIDADYPQIIKTNLKVAFTPTVLYIKGNKLLLRERSFSVDASGLFTPQSIMFAKNMAIQTDNNSVLVCGSEKNIGKYTLDAVIAHHGKSIIVLQQGIMMFSTGFKTYYRQIINGEMLILSATHPRATLQTGKEKGCENIINGLSAAIYIAQTSIADDLWTGAINGLKKGRSIFARVPESGEPEDNLTLIKNGAIPVDITGKPLKSM